MEIGWRDWALLHVYGQPSWHGELLVVGNERGLLALRRAIDIALEHGAGMAGAIENDGEGYWVQVAKIDDPMTSEIPVAYVEEYARPKDRQWPEALMVQLDGLTAEKARAWGIGFAWKADEEAYAETKKKL